MVAIDDFKHIINTLKAQNRPRRLAIAWAEDEITRNAVAQALAAGIVTPTFVGCRQQVEADEVLKPYADKIEIIDAADGDDAAAKAVELVRQGKADVIMKGMINTDNLLRAVLNKEHGILTKGTVMTHITAIEIPSHDKIILFTDAAVIPYPTPDQLRAQVKYIVDLAHRLGVEEPKVALIHCSEKVDAKHFPHTQAYVDICEMARNGEFGRCIVDGPYDVKVACNTAAMKKKHIESPVNGQADALVFPDIQAGNVFYKTLTLWAGANTGGVVVGPQVPLVVPSRGDSPVSKFNSIALACALA